MSWFGGKATHEKQIRAAVQVWSSLYEKTTTGGADAPLVLRFGAQDSKLRYMMFCLSAMQTACARRMSNPDAVLNEMLHTIIAGAVTADNPLFVGDADADNQEVANRAAAYIQDYLNRWSSYVDIVAGNPSAATGIVCGMLKHTESSEPASASDGPRLWPLATWIEARIEAMGNAFASMGP